MKRKDFKPCMFCNQGVAHDNQIAFFKVEVTYQVLDGKAIQREHGLEEFFGGGQQGARLANVMGDDPHLSHKVGFREGLVCLSCAEERRIIQFLETKE